MPANYSRVEVRFSRKNRERLNNFKKEAKGAAGRSVSMSDLVDEIVGQFFARIELSENSDDDSCNLFKKG